MVLLSILSNYISKKILNQTLLTKQNYFAVVDLRKNLCGTRETTCDKRAKTQLDEMLSEVACLFLSDSVFTSYYCNFHIIRNILRRLHKTHSLPPKILPFLFLLILLRKYTNLYALVEPKENLALVYFSGLEGSTKVHKKQNLLI